jgi:hypothetical protein
MTAIPPVYFEGEQEAIEQVLRQARKWGYGRMIGVLKTEWAEKLHREHGLSKKIAREAADVDI